MIEFLPGTFTKATRIEVVVPAPEDAGTMFDPATGRTVVPARVEMSVTAVLGTDRGDREYAFVAVIGPRRLKSGADGQPINTHGWENEVVEGRYGYRYRPSWLDTCIAEHLPAVLDIAARRAER